jgi:hypothetical protein
LNELQIFDLLKSHIGMVNKASVKVTVKGRFYLSEGLKSLVGAFMGAKYNFAYMAWWLGPMDLTFYEIWWDFKFKVGNLQKKCCLI